MVLSPHTSALYYPTIDIRDGAWLRSAALYWENIYTIVPKHIGSPYASADSRALADAKILRPQPVSPDLPDVESLADDAQALFGSQSWQRAMEMDASRDTIYAGKLPYLIQETLREAGHARGGGDRFEVPPGAAYLYMTLLANRLAASTHAAPITDIPASRDLAQQALLDPHEGAAPPGAYAQGIMAKLAIAGIGLSEDIPIAKIVEFRDDHRASLSKLRRRIALLTEDIDASNAPALEQKLQDTYHDQVVPVFDELEHALRDRRFAFARDQAIEVGRVIPQAASTAAITGPLGALSVALGGAWRMILRTVDFRRDREKALRDNDFSYLFEAKRSLEQKAPPAANTDRPGRPPRRIKK